MIKNKFEMEKIKKVKTFDDLIEEVHKKGLCGECGGCVSFCSAIDLGAIKMVENGPPQYIDKDKCLECGLCYLICPVTRDLNKELNSRYENVAPIGKILKISSAKASDPEIHEKGTDGGVVTAMLVALLENKLIDGALIAKKVGPFQRKPLFATTKEEIIGAAGIKFGFQGNIESLGRYNTFIPLVSKMKKIANKERLRIALVGVPCQIHSLRKMQELGILPAHIVKYTFGLFCYENFKFDEAARKDMEKKFGFSFDDIEKINVKDRLILRIKNREEPLLIDFSDLEEIMRPACKMCDNFSNVYADLSFGGIGSPDGFTTVVVRTKVGEKLFNLAMKKEYIEEQPELNTTAKIIQIKSKIIKMGTRKSKRLLAKNLSDD